MTAKKKTKIHVVFRKSHGKYIDAFFPQMVVRPYNILCCDEYGHGEATVEFYQSTEKATPEEYADLLKILRGIYDDDEYELVVKQRMNWKMLSRMWTTGKEQF